jgi:4-carboxymuconolactone decarboxylase
VRGSTRSTSGACTSPFSRKRPGLTDGQVAATRAATSDAVAGFPTNDGLLIRLVDELVDTARVTDALWLELGAVWAPAALVELVAVVGFYHGVSFATNAFQIPLESFAARFPG